MVGLGFPYSQANFMFIQFPLHVYLISPWQDNFSIITFNLSNYVQPHHYFQYICTTHQGRAFYSRPGYPATTGRTVKVSTLLTGLAVIIVRIIRQYPRLHCKACQKYNKDKYLTSYLLYLYSCRARQRSTSVFATFPPLCWSPTDWGPIRDNPITLFDLVIEPVTCCSVVALRQSIK